MSRYSKICVGKMSPGLLDHLLCLQLFSFIVLKDVSVAQILIGFNNKNVESDIRVNAER